MISMEERKWRLSCNVCASGLSRTKGEIMLTKKNRKNAQSGVTVVEYAIMLALIAIAVAVAAPNITSAVTGVFSKASSVMNK